MFGEHNRSNSTDTISNDSQDELFEHLSDLRFAVVKISNISWDLTSNDVVEFLDPILVEKRHVHFPVDRTTGKTKAGMYVELPSLIEAIKCIHLHNRKIWKSRVVTMTISSMEELYNAHFKTQEILSLVEATSIVNICKNYKAHFSRKCAERPFEHVISILRLTPWHQLDSMLIERLYKMTLGAVEALSDHLNRNNHLRGKTLSFSSSDSMLLTNLFDPKTPNSPTTAAITGNYGLPTIQLGPDLMNRMLIAASEFPAFTTVQKQSIKMVSQNETHPEVVKPKFGTPVQMAFATRPAKHLRQSSIDRILEELKNGSNQRNEAMDRLMKDAFDQIMLSKHE